MNTESFESDTLAVIDLQQLPVSEEEVPPEQQHCEKEWSPNLGQEVKEEQEELRTSQVEEQLQGLEEDFIFSSAFVKSDNDQDPSQSSDLHQTQSVENRQRDPVPCTSTEQINTETDEENSVSDPTSDSRPLSAANPQCSAAQIENNAYQRERGGPQSLGLMGIQTVKGQWSCFSTNEGRISMELSHLKSPSSVIQSPALPLCYCKVCGKSFISMISLVTHMTIHIMDEDHLCGVCGKHFDSTESMQEHLQTHIDTRFSCHVCSKRFTVNTELIMHMAIHEGDKSFKCSYCGKCFSNRSNMNKHIRSHTGEKPYQCPHCGKGFSSSSNLKVHIKSHTGEKPYPCRFCGKRFIQKAHMELHVKIHTGEKPHSCDVCGKCFLRGSDMKVHMRRHTGEKPLNCSFCERNFAACASLTVHMRTHTEEKSYVCPVCRKCYISSSALGTHKKSHTENRVNISIGAMVGANASIRRSPYKGTVTQEEVKVAFLKTT
ncbi:zinc finger protein 501-like [Salvelinus fontinalis]|uniref:zinc finger protein 501-like n=1 Tax=Salvelinus fontinalis TaxID=8038 RepID=UPI002486B5D9|nr:zinc finger protein 501-like [Salvelinus fontinalis]